MCKRKSCELVRKDECNELDHNLASHQLICFPFFIVFPLFIVLYYCSTAMILTIE